MNAEEWSVDEVKDAFCAVARVLQAKAEMQSDWLDGKAKIAQLEIFLAHAQRVSEREELLHFCCAVLDKFNAFSLPANGAYIFAMANKNFRKDLKIDLKSILSAGLNNLHHGENA